MSRLLDAALETIRAKRADFETRYGIRLIGVVGSVARGEDDTESDVDIVFEVAGRPNLVSIVHAESELGHVLNRTIDLVAREGLKPERRLYMERDLVSA